MPGFGDDYASQVELDRRLQELSDRIDQRALANPDTTTTARSGGTPPSPSGITLVATPAPGTITVKWNAVPISDLRRYEIQVADNVDFTSPSTFSRSTTTFTYDEGTPLTTYYIRVRTINNSNNPSGWSEVLNTTTGQARSGDLLTGAAVNWARTVVTTFVPSQIKNYGGGPGQGDYASTTLTTKGGLVLYFAQAQIDYSLLSGEIAYVEILQDGFVEERFPTSQTTTAVSTGTSSSGGAGIIPPPLVGTHTYALRVRLMPLVGGSFITPQQLAVAVVEVGREGLL